MIFEIVRASLGCIAGSGPCGHRIRRCPAVRPGPGCRAARPQPGV